MTLQDHAARFNVWLADAALPLWRDRGFAETTGFVETIAQDGTATGAPVRARVNPRQVYCFAEAGRLGWKGDWQGAVSGGLARFDAVYGRADGLFGNLATLDGTLVDDGFDLYNQAFALLAFASIANVLAHRKSEMAVRAESLLALLHEGYTHPVAGFEEASPPKTPLCSNPHMHLFEAALAWEIANGPQDGTWTGLADEIAHLCLDMFIDGETGALREFFDHDWRPFAGDKGRVVEPGHQFEWAWLLMRWSGRRGGNDRAVDAARRLFEIGEARGIDTGRGVAVMTLDDALTVTDPTARLWVQTEWLKSALILAGMQGEDRARYESSAERACEALEAFLQSPTAGLWRDKQRADGGFVDEPAPASSFYHIVCAIGELNDYIAGRLG